MCPVASVALNIDRLDIDHSDNHMIGDLLAFCTASINDIADGRYGSLHGLPLVEVGVQKPEVERLPDSLKQK